MDVLGTSLLATKVLGERSSAFSTDKLSMTLDRQTPVKMSRKTFGKGKEKVTLPSAGTLFRSFSENIESLDVQVLKVSHIARICMLALFLFRAHGTRTRSRKF